MYTISNKTITYIYSFNLVTNLNLVASVSHMLPLLILVQSRQRNYLATANVSFISIREIFTVKEYNYVLILPKSNVKSRHKMQPSIA